MSEREELELTPPVPLSEWETQAGDLVAAAEGQLEELWDPIDDSGEPKPWRLCAAEVRIAIGHLTRAAELMEALAKEERR